MRSSAQTETQTLQQQQRFRSRPSLSLTLKHKLHCYDVKSLVTSTCYWNNPTIHPWCGLTAATTGHHPRVITSCFTVELCGCFFWWWADIMGDIKDFLCYFYRSSRRRKTRRRSCRRRRSSVSSVGIQFSVSEFQSCSVVFRFSISRRI